MALGKYQKNKITSSQKPKNTECILFERNLSNSSTYDKWPRERMICV